MKKNELGIEKSFIDYLVKTIKENNLGSLEITRSLTDKQKLKIKISNSNSFSSQQETIVANDDNVDQRQNFIQKDNPSSSNITQSMIKSPMVGTVFLSPSPEEPTFIHVGKKIKKGDTILIIEAMKTMNQIPSSLEGTVKEILVSNESPVEFDTPLIIVE